MFESQGYLIVHDMFPADQLPPLREETDRLLRESAARGGVRNALSKSPLLYELSDL
jgi:hypothetical protein